MVMGSAVLVISALMVNHLRENAIIRVKDICAGITVNAIFEPAASSGFVTCVHKTNGALHVVVGVVDQFNSFVDACVSRSGGKRKGGDSYEAFHGVVSGVYAPGVFAALA